MKKIMILGAGISQLPLIQTAKKMGLYTIVVSQPGNYPGFAWADHVCPVNTTDVEQIVNIARQERIDGICTTGTDIAVKAIAKTADELGVPGVSYQSALTASNKYEMKQRFIEHGVRTALFRKVYQLEEAIEAANEFGYPVMCKAVDSGASKGIAKVMNERQIERAFQIAMQATRLPYVIIEQFIEGTEFGAQSFVYDHQVKFIMPHGDFVYYGDAGVPVGHYVPYELSRELKADMEFQLIQSIRALGLNECAVNADFIMKKDQVYVLEVGARAGATCLPELVSTYYGINYYEIILKAALGQGVDASFIPKQPCGCELIISDQAGIISRLEYDYPQSEDVLEINFDYEPGQAIRKFHVGTDRIGHIVVKGKDVESVLTLLEEVKQHIHLQLV